MDFQDDAWKQGIITRKENYTSKEIWVGKIPSEDSIPFISNPSPIRGSSSNHNSPLQLHLDGEESEDTKGAIAHIE